MPGSPDLVDVDFEIEEGLPGQFGGSLGFSETFGVTLGGNFIHSNFMGTGRRVALELRGGEYQKVYDINFTDPYRNIDGVVAYGFVDVPGHHAIHIGDVGLFDEVPLRRHELELPDRELPALDVRFRVSRLRAAGEQLQLGAGAEWVSENGNPFQVDQNFIGTKVKSLDLVTAWQYDTRNAALFPTAGTRMSMGLNASVPGSEIEYYVASVDFTKYVVLPGKWLFRINSELSYGDAFGETTSLPPFRNRYGGGPGSVRGFKESYLGPRDRFGNPYGGNALFANQFELIIPTPEKIAGSTRIALFFDVGGVFSTGGVNFFDKLGDPIDYDFGYDKLKKSVGLGVEWLAPLGLLRFSYAAPLNEDAATDRFCGDEVERFQFSIGNAF